MTGIYYTTDDIKKMFGWKSEMTIIRRRKAGDFPEPDLPGRPNKWLKSTINAMIAVPDSDSVDLSSVNQTAGR